MIQIFFTHRDNKASDNTLEASATLVGSGSSGSAIQQPEALNKKALDIVQRVRDKLTGNFTIFFSISAVSQRLTFGAVSARTAMHSWKKLWKQDVIWIHNLTFSLQVAILMPMNALLLLSKSTFSFAKPPIMKICANAILVGALFGKLLHITPSNSHNLDFTPPARKLFKPTVRNHV